MKIIVPRGGGIPGTVRNVAQPYPRLEDECLHLAADKVRPIILSEESECGGGPAPDFRTVFGQRADADASKAKKTDKVISTCRAF